MRRIPEDLSTPAVKLARRIQALPTGRLYLVICLKLPAAWFAFLLTPDGIKMEKLEK